MIHEHEWYVGERTTVHHNVGSKKFLISGLTHKTNAILWKCVCDKIDVVLDKEWDDARSD